MTGIWLWTRRIVKILLGSVSRSTLLWLIRPTIPGALVGLMPAAYAGSYTVGSILGIPGVTFWPVVFGLVAGVLAFVSAYLATAHLFGVLAGILFKFLTKTVGSIVFLLVGFGLIFPFTAEPETAFQQAGGLVFLTSPSVSKIEAVISLDAIGDVEPLLNVDVTVDGQGPATIAVVGSGPSEFEAAAMISGSYKGQQTVSNEAPVRTDLPIIEVIMPLVDAHDLVEMGDEGMRLSRGETLSREVSGNWFSPDSAGAFKFDIVPTDVDTQFTQKFSFMLRLSEQSTANIRSGNLGQIGCPMYLVQAANKSNAGEFADRLFSLPLLEAPLTTPEICDMKVLISQVSNSTVLIAGVSREVTTPEKIMIKKTSTAAGLDLIEAVNTLTLPRTDWLVGETEEQDGALPWGDIKFWVGTLFMGAGFGYLYRLHFRSWLMRLRGWAGRVSDSHVGSR